MLLGAGSARALQQLDGHRPEAVTNLNLQPTGRLPGSTRLQLAIGLPLRNQEALGALLQQLYDPTSPRYRQYLTPKQFTEMFGPTEQDYQAIIAFATAHGLTVTTRHPNRVVVDVAGKVADIENAFHVKMQVYQHPREPRTFYAPDVEPSLDLAVPILHISGLDNYSLPHPMHVVKPVPAIKAMQATPNYGSGPNGGYMGKDFRAAYVPGTSLTGSGQSVGLLQFDGYTASDITYYESMAGLSAIPLQNVLIDGATGGPGGGEVEVSLDIEMVASMAPGVSQIIVYMAPNPSPWIDLLSRMATDNLAKQLSCSWTGGGPDPTCEAVFQQMAAQGQSFFTASGDSDALTTSIAFPSDSTNITVVGGTTLTTTAAGGSYYSETVWNWGEDGSSGGISTYYPIPAYQQGINMAANHGSTTMRNVPDVALTADNVYVRVDGADENVGGTSCATPLWAGFTALINQQAASFGKPTVGFLNPAVYAIGQGATYTNCFHDITTGNNFNSSSPSNFPAVAGYDLCTGWGTPNGTNLIDALAFPSLRVSLPAAATKGAGVLAGQSSVGIAAALTNALSVALVSGNTNKVLVPPTVVIPAGATNATFNITIVDNGLLDGTQYATVTASAPGYGNASATMTVYDNETATLTLTAPAAATKGQGLLTNAGAVFVSAPPASDVAVALTSSDSTKVVLPPTVTIPAGQTSNAFNITVLDNHLTQTPEAVTLTAHVQNWTNGTAVITVYNDTNLTVILPASSVYKNAGVLPYYGLVMIDAPLSTDLLVNLSSSNTNKVVVPSSVIIYAGQTSQGYTVTIVDNDIPDGTQIATVTASATGCASGSASIAVKDNIAYQFGLSNVASPQSAGTPFTVSIAAMDINGATITVYQTALSLSAAGSGGADSVQPTTITGWTNGVWTGAVCVNTIDSNVRLTANNGAGLSVQSNPFNVLLGPVDHFAWATVPSPQHQDTPFPVTVTARDAGNNVVPSFTGPVALTGIGAKTGPGQLVTFDDLPGSNLPVPAGYGGLTWNNFNYLIGLDWQASGYCPGTVSPSNVVFNDYGAPASITCTAQFNFVSAYLTAAWNDNLQLEAKGYVGANLTYDTTNTLSATAPTLINFNYMGVTEVDFISSGGTNHPGYGASGTQFAMDNMVTESVTSPVSISPTNSGNFVSGVWTGAVAVLEACTNVYLRAGDGTGHCGTSTLFNVTATVDLAAALSAAPEPVQAGSNLTYQITISNFGPDRAANVVFSDALPPNVTVVSATFSQGSVTQSAGTVGFSLSSLTNGGTATATMTVTPAIQGSLTNTVTVSNSATDSNPANNSATVVSTVQGRGSLAVIPAINLAFAGVPGSFSPGSQTYALTNNGTAPISWLAANTTAWVSLSSSGGTLGAHTVTNIAVSINANANGLAFGAYTNSITFTNLTNGAGTTNRNVFLNVVLPPSITNQPLSRTVGTGNNVTLSVGVAGTGPFRYQWQLNGVNLPNNIISTVAGAFALGDGGSATNAGLDPPYSVAVDATGNLFIADYVGSRIRKVSTNGVITTVAGNGSYGYSGDGDAATNASLAYPYGVAVDAAGDLFIADSGNNRIRMVSTNGVIRTVAGNGSSGFSGDGGVATSTSLSSPYGVAVDATGNLFIADSWNGRVREVSNGIITTVAGNGSFAFSGDGGAATNASLNYPNDIAVDAAGNLFIADSWNNRIRKVSNGVITTVAGNGSYGFSGDGGAATNARLAYPYGVAVDAVGNLFIADSSNNRIRKVSTNGTITTAAGNGSYGFSGDDGAATNASLDSPYSVAVDATGNLFIADSSNNRIRKVSNGVITTVAGNGSPGYSGDGGLATNANLNNPYGVAVDAFGGIFIADSDNQRVRKVSTNGIITTVAGNGAATFAGDNGTATNASLNSPYGVAVDALGEIFIADCYNQRIRKVSPGGVITTAAGNGAATFAGDNGTATSASLNYPYGVAADAFGEILIADSFNSRFRLVNPDGIITTAAGNGTAIFAGDNGTATTSSLNYPFGAAADASGNLFIADTYNERIRKISPAGTITTVAGRGNAYFSGDGGVATNASLCLPSGVAVDAFGEIFIADSYNHRIREVTPAGIITTIAGNGMAGYSGDGGPATSASLNYPFGVAVDASGNLFIADTDNHRIRAVGLAGSPTLSLCNVTTNNSGNYSVIISSPYGSVTSSVATLTMTNAPYLVVNPGSLNYGSVVVGQGGSLSFLVINNGDLPLAGTAASATPFAVTGGSPYNLPSGWTGTVTVAFAPGTTGAFNGSVVFASNGGDSTNAVSGTGVIAPVAAFSGSPTSGAAPLAVTFTDASTGTITNWFWSFGDGATSNTTLGSLGHVYNAAGTYPVSLTVFGPGGSSMTNLINYIAVANTNAPPDNTPPLLTVLVPANYQTFTNAAITVAGTASDASGIPSVTVNGVAVSVVGTNWATTFTLSSGTNTITVIATDASANRNTATQVVHAILNAPPDNTPPLLTVLVPANYQTFTNAAITVAGTASDASGIPSVTVNGVGVSMLGTNWATTFTLSSGTNTITVVATDASAYRNTATQVVHAILNTVIPTNHPPEITAGLSVTNALLQAGNTAVVLVDDTNAFSVTVTNSDGNPLEYQWVFGDGDGSNTTIGAVEHAYTNECGSYNASVTISDGRASTNSDLVVAVACQMQITTLQVKLDFAKTNSDSCTILGTFVLPPDYNFAGKLVTLDVGGAEVSFTLPSKGSSARNGQSTFVRKSYDSPTGWCNFRATLKNRSWQTLWANYGMISSNIPEPGVLVPNFPVILVVDDDAFMQTMTLQYTAKSGKTGTAR